MTYGNIITTVQLQVAFLRRKLSKPHEYILVSKMFFHFILRRSESAEDELGTSDFPFKIFFIDAASVVKNETTQTNRSLQLTKAREKCKRAMNK